MKIKHLKAEHRCKKCNTPLNFCHNHTLDEDEEQKLYEEKVKQMKGIRKTLYLIFGRERWVIDKERQYWTCPNCHEDYLIDLR